MSSHNLDFSRTPEEWSKKIAQMKASGKWEEAIFQADLEEMRLFYSHPQPISPMIDFQGSQSRSSNLEEELRMFYRLPHPISPIIDEEAPPSWKQNDDQVPPKKNVVHRTAKQANASILSALQEKRKRFISSEKSAKEKKPRKTNAKKTTGPMMKALKRLANRK